MKIALPVWQERISPVFDTARTLLVIEYQDNREVERIIRELPEKSLTERVRLLADLEVNRLICGAISNQLANLVLASGIQVIPFVTGEVNDILHAFLSDRIHDARFFMPGCRGRCRRRQANRKARRSWRNGPPP